VGLRIVFAAGGTGGHIYPALAIAGELRKLKPDTEFMFIAGKKGMERNIIEKAGYPLITLPVTGMPRTLSPRLVPFVWNLAVSILGATNILRSFRPSIVFATGGYVSGPPVLAASMKGIPVAIQEQNSYPGITNRKLARYADIVFLGFGEAARFFTAATETIETGNPVRAEIGTGDRVASTALFGLDPGRRTLLVFGGSQGSRALNTVLAASIEGIASTGAQVIWQTGRGEYDTCARFDGLYDNSVRVLPYIDDMVSAYAASDLIVSRAGAMAIAEITACGLPAIFVPLPSAAANHQEKNARSLEEAGAALTILESGLTAEILTEAVGGILRDDDRRAEMAKASRARGKKNAAADIAAIVIDRYAGN
jgi:UDP-N-acetylglucosamine--N-acetylmuramyl-(pentapeptide) pyrophosphoryl-undecaprenol N-acetylglucosamine transferase